ncbi:MAG: hypothetical protein ACF8Q5_01695 [Phycisphaerales bacterium JB040]
METPRICGRCGYDLSGVVASWDDREHPACDLCGTCSECGHAFEWREVIRAHDLAKPWLIEHAPTRSGVIRKILPTTARVMTPWWFWRGLSMNAPVRLGRAGVWLLVVVLTSQFVVNTNELRSIWGAHTARYIQIGYTVDPPVLDSPETRAAAVNLVMRPAARLRVGRVPVYVTNPNGTNTFTSFRIRATSILDPLGSPAFLHASLVYALSIPVIFLILPVVRARAGLRWVHLGRACIYGAGLSVIVVQVARTLTHSAQDDEYTHQAWALLASMIAVSSWWGCAIIIGWRLQRGVLLSLLLFMLAGILSLTTALLHDVFFLDHGWGVE